VFMEPIRRSSYLRFGAVELTGFLMRSDFSHQSFGMTLSMREHVIDQSMIVTIWTAGATVGTYENSSSIARAASIVFPPCSIGYELLRPYTWRVLSPSWS